MEKQFTTPQDKDLSVSGMHPLVWQQILVHLLQADESPRVLSLPLPMTYFEHQMRGQSLQQASLI